MPEPRTREVQGECVNNKFTPRVSGQGHRAQRALTGAGQSALGFAVSWSPVEPGIIAAVLTRQPAEVILPARSAPQSFECSEKAAQALCDALASGEKLIGDRVQMHGHNEYARTVVLPQLAGIGSF